MRKNLFIVMVLILSLIIIGCSNVNAADVEYTGYLRIKEYREENTEGYSEDYYHLIVKNNTKGALYIEAAVAAKDAEGKTLGTEKMRFPVVGAGESSYNYVVFWAQGNPFSERDYTTINGADIKSVSVELDYRPNTDLPQDNIAKDYIPVVSGISVSKYEYTDKEYVVCVLENKGDYDADYLRAHVLFFDENNSVLNEQSYYCPLKKGEKRAITAEYQFSGFDHTEIYLSGYATAITSSQSDEVTLDDLEIIGEYSFDHFHFWPTGRFKIVRNNSDRTIELTSNSIVYNNKTPLISDQYIIDALAPGQTSFVHFNYGGISLQDIEDVEDVYFINTEPTYTPLQSIQYEIENNDHGVLVSLTNNSSLSANWIQTVALFFDVDGNLVYYDKEYFYSEIYPGETASKQFECPVQFDRVEFYYNGSSDSE